MFHRLHSHSSTRGWAMARRSSIGLRRRTKCAISVWCFCPSFRSGIHFGQTSDSRIWCGAAAFRCSRRGGCGGSKMAPLREPRSQPAETGMLAVASLHVIVRFEPMQGKGKPYFGRSCSGLMRHRAPKPVAWLSMFLSRFASRLFALHSEWVDEAAFELHATLPQTRQFLAAAEKLLTHRLQGLGLQHIGGG